MFEERECVPLGGRRRGVGGRRRHRPGASQWPVTVPTVHSERHRDERRRHQPAERALPEETDARSR